MKHIIERRVQKITQDYVTAIEETDSSEYISNPNDLDYFLYFVALTKSLKALIENLNFEIEVV